MAKMLGMVGQERFDTRPGLRVYTSQAELVVAARTGVSVNTAQAQLVVAVEAGTGPAVDSGCLTELDDHNGTC
jgi:hypothetical protein